MLPEEENPSIEQYWDVVAPRYLEMFRQELQSKPYDQTVLSDFAKSVGAGARVCDAGCGPCGHVTQFLADQSLNVIGVDISRECIRLARREKPDLQFERMDLRSMTFPDSSLDGVVSYYVLHYLQKDEWASAMGEFSRVLRPGGKLLLVLKKGEEESYKDDPLGSGQKVFWRDSNEKELQQLLIQTGFTIINAAERNPLSDEIQVRRIYLNAFCSKG